MKPFFTPLLVFAVALTSLACQKAEEAQPVAPTPSATLTDRVLTKASELSYGNLSLAGKKFAKVSITGGGLTEANVKEMEATPSGKFVARVASGQTGREIYYEDTNGDYRSWIMAFEGNGFSNFRVLLQTKVAGQKAETNIIYSN